ncbi:putative 2-hydroxyacylsphingosine 1-beta-galactosyltransferase [Rosellinia necatrix]|uniref:Putative 2-hydroxyacylsphingosine 1-beta-galactosyltransferase n=1 Tax=Rosellinia necatrix TaxID=77044 RepID=A0A1W2TSA4_ROSNE|nr:putative 2-hydroxyacylsphingosine 1-beta-galactosyltransferase [Rosellinia necatrix]
MLRGLFLAGAALIAGLALLSSWWTTLTSAPPIAEIRQGRNNTVLFLTNTEHGLSNVFVATAYTLLERHPGVEVHYASFPQLARKLERVSEQARRTQPAAGRVIFHEVVPDLSFLSIMAQAGSTPVNVIHPPGLAGVDTVLQLMPLFTSLWSGEDHMILYERFQEIIAEVDPSIVVLDAFMRPALDAVRNSSRLHAFISPLTPIEVFPLEQPYGTWLWKYPIMGTGIPFPVPWSRLLENVYANARYFYAMLRMAHFAPTRRHLAARGVAAAGPVNWFSLRGRDVPWFTQALPGASVPLAVVPRNVTLTGPILLSPAPAAEQAPALAAWLARGPTLLVNLGSLFVWTDAHAAAMARALADTLRARPDLQVLWKFVPAPPSSAGDDDEPEALRALRPFIEAGRLRVESWLDAQPVSLLQTGNIVASVHHGGAGCYSEALGTGVPQVILPQWLDLYSFARLAQDIGIGVWGCPDASPYWEADCLRDAFATVLSSDSIRKEAKRFGDIAQREPGQYITAREIAKLAASGYAP